MGVDAEMLVRTRADLSEQDLRSIGRRLFSMFGWQKFCGWHDDSKQPPVYRVDSWEQDGPTIHPEAGETFLRLRLSTRYYGVDYERGDLPFLVALAEALEVLIPHSAVWYGGDSSGVLAEPFGRKRREALKAHFFRVAHDPYHRHFDREQRDGEVVNPLCERCQEQMTRFGWGKEFAKFCCPCGEEVVVRGKRHVRTTAVDRRREHYRIRNAALDAYFAVRPDEANRWNEVDEDA